MKSCQRCGAGLKLGARACTACHHPVSALPSLAPSENLSEARMDTATVLVSDATDFDARDLFAADTLPPLSRIGAYTVQSVLGQGAMGVVYEVTDDGGRRFALKRIRQDFATDRTVQRFVREGRALQKIDHPGVVHVVGLGADEWGPYLVTEFLEGKPLDQLLVRGTLRARHAARFVASLADAVEAVHRAGVLHRDLKPSNIVVRPDGQPVLIDFGIARFEDGDDLTRTGTILGTPAFASPEQLTANKALTAQTDVFGLGGILYTCVTNEAPNAGQSVSEVVRKAKVESRWPTQRMIPLELEELGRRALARDLSERYKSAGEFKAALEGWLLTQRA